MQHFVYFLLLAVATAKGQQWNDLPTPDQDLSFLSNEHYTWEDLEVLRDVFSPEQLYKAGLNCSQSQCACDLLYVHANMLLFKPWAWQMFDSTAKFPEGLLKANHEFLGQYDECLEVTNDKFVGEHCILRGEIGQFGFPGVPAGQKLFFFYGTCVPSTCSPADMTQRFAWIGKLTGNRVTLKGVDGYCHTSEKEEPSTGAYIVIAFLCLLGFCGIISTAYDVHQRLQLKNNKPHPLWSSFSVYSNSKALFSISKADGQMSCLSGIRVLSMVWIVFFHTCTTLLAAPIVNITDNFAAKSQPLYALLFSAFLSVDTFLLLSGLLLAYSFFRGMARTGSYDAPLGYIHRYLRLTPSYAMLLLFQVTVFKYIGDGPMWNFLEDSQTSVCNDYWWSGLLYVQNYVNPDNLCLTQTWYLSADMQLYWLAPLLLYPMYKWPKFAGYLVGLMTLIFTFLPFALACVYGFAPIPLLDTTGKQNSLDNYPTYSRATPWLVGVALGYLICILQQKKIKVRISTFWVIIGWLLAAAVSSLSLFGLIAFENDESYKPGEESYLAAFYLAFHRLGWSVAVAWMIFACVYGYGGPIDGFLSWSFFQPLGKLSYSVYLTHVSVILYRLGIIRTNIYFNIQETFFMFLSIWMVSHFVGILLFLFIENPFLIIERYLFRNLKIFPYPKPKPKPKPTKEEKQTENAA